MRTLRDGSKHVKQEFAHAASHERLPSLPRIDRPPITGPKRFAIFQYRLFDHFDRTISAWTRHDALWHRLWFHDVEQRRLGLAIEPHRGNRVAVSIVEKFEDEIFRVICTVKETPDFSWWAVDSYRQNGGIHEADFPHEVLEIGPCSYYSINAVGVG